MIAYPDTCLSSAVTKYPKKFLHSAESLMESHYKLAELTEYSVGKMRLEYCSRITVLFVIAVVDWPLRET